MFVAKSLAPKQAQLRTVIVMGWPRMGSVMVSVCLAMVAQGEEDIILVHLGGRAARAMLGATRRR